MKLFYENGWNLPEEEEEPPPSERPKGRSFVLCRLADFNEQLDDGTKKRSGSFTPALPPPVRRGVLRTPLRSRRSSRSCLP